MRLRKGDYSHAIGFEDVEIEEGSSFVGNYIAGCALSFIIVWFLLGLALVPFTLIIVWITLWDYIP